MTQILGIFDISLESALKLIESYTGREMSAMFRELFEFRSAGLSSVVFAAIALWAGSRASFSIMRITNYTLTGGKSTGRNYFIERFRAIKTIVITIFTISFSLIILAYGKLILEAILSVLRLIHKYMPTTYGCGSDGYWAFFFTSLWSAIILSVAYGEDPVQEDASGQLICFVGMLLVTVGYSKYASSLAEYDLLYGALSSVVGIMFWFYLLAWVLCLGVLCIKVWDDTRVDFSKRTPLYAECEITVSKGIYERMSNDNDKKITDRERSR